MRDVLLDNYFDINLTGTREELHHQYHQLQKQQQQQQQRLDAFEFDFDELRLSSYDYHQCVCFPDDSIETVPRADRRSENYVISGSSSDSGTGTGPGPGPGSGSSSDSAAVASLNTQTGHEVKQTSVLGNSGCAYHACFHY